MAHFFHFYGGIHPSEDKVARQSPIRQAPLLPLYTVPLSMHIGAPAKPEVAVGDTVKRGQLLASPAGFVSAAVHAPTSGKIKSIGFCTGPAGIRAAGCALDGTLEDVKKRLAEAAAEALTDGA